MTTMSAPSADRSPAPVVVLGSLNMDLIGRTVRFPEAGQTVLGSTFSTAPGGKGGNQAVAAARAGAAVRLVAALGDDAFADELRTHLQAAGVRTELVRTVPGASGVAMITVDDTAENTIVVLPGANGRLDALDTATTAAIGQAGVLLAQLEVPPATVLAAARTAREAGVPVILNPSPAIDVPAELWPLVTVVVVNETEAAFYGDHLDTVDHLITTLGARGCTVRGPGGEVHAVEAFAVEPVDTTGAGDAFAGTLAAAWAAGVEPTQAVRRACAAGALATTVPGAGTSAPTSREVDALLAHS